MKELKQIFEKRCSVRSFAKAEVEQEKINAMIEAFRLAPSAVNRQPWRLYVVSSPKMKAAIVSAYERDWFAEASLYFVVCSRHDESWVRADGKDHADVDVSIATEHLVLEATALGLGTCWVCNFDATACKKVLGITDKAEEPVVIIPVGYPKDESLWKKEKSRKQVSDFVKFI